jgi:hypothetical protein
LPLTLRRCPCEITGISSQPDLIYARFLASHLPEPEQAISGWAKKLKAGGILLLEEVESINTAVAAFDAYLKIVSEVLAQHGNELFVGARLATTRWDALRIRMTAEELGIPVSVQYSNLLTRCRIAAIAE